MVGPSRVLRTIYSRPAFIDYRSEVALEKTIFVDSPNAESYPIIPVVSGSSLTQCRVVWKVAVDLPRVKSYCGKWQSTHPGQSYALVSGS